MGSVQSSLDSQTQTRPFSLQLVGAMESALDAARKGISAGQSPFGAAVIDQKGSLIVAAHNTVRATNDPTAHAEVNAIRQACHRLGTIDLSEYLMATTCEPCPMCAAAIHWSRIGEVAFGATINDAAAAGFNELRMPCEFLLASAVSPTKVRSGLMAESCRCLFREWQSGPNANPY